MLIRCLSISCMLLLTLSCKSHNATTAEASNTMSEPTQEPSKEWNSGDAYIDSLLAIIDKMPCENEVKYKNKKIIVTSADSGQACVHPYLMGLIEKQEGKVATLNPFRTQAEGFLASFQRLPCVESGVATEQDGFRVKTKTPAKECLKDFLHLFTTVKEIGSKEIETSSRIEVKCTGDGGLTMTFIRDFKSPKYETFTGNLYPFTEAVGKSGGENYNFPNCPIQPGSFMGESFCLAENETLTPDTPPASAAIFMPTPIGPSGMLLIDGQQKQLSCKFGK
ncbi:MAG: hypothetical protein AB7T49_10185 [Oligoflexales bacterium]